MLITYFVHGNRPTSVPKLTNGLTNRGLLITFSVFGLSSGLRCSNDDIRVCSDLLYFLSIGGILSAACMILNTSAGRF